MGLISSRVTSDRRMERTMSRISDATSIDISDSPELLRLTEQANESGKPVVLRRGDEVIAVLRPPLRRPGWKRKPPTEEQMASFRSALGSWADVGTDTMFAQIYECRERSMLPLEDQRPTYSIRI